MEAITTAFTSAVTSMSTNALSLIAAGLPQVMPVAAAVIALTTGWSVIRRFING